MPEKQQASSQYADASSSPASLNHTYTRIIYTNYMPTMLVILKMPLTNRTFGLLSSWKKRRWKIIETLWSNPKPKRYRKEKPYRKSQGPKHRRHESDAPHICIREKIGKMEKKKEPVNPLLYLQPCGSYGAFPRIRMSSMPLRRHEAIKIAQTARR
jgi:hypothetical protein